MKLVTGNNIFVDQYNEISIHVFLNGYSFIVKNITANKVSVILKQTHSNHDFVACFNDIAIDIHSVKIYWDYSAVELIPNNLYEELYKNNSYDFANKILNNEIVVAWNATQFAVEQINYLFGNAPHFHVMEKLIEGNNVVKIIQSFCNTYVVVLGNNGLENYIVMENTNAADVLYYIKKNVKNDSKYRFQLVGNEREFISTIEQYVNVNGILTQNPVLQLCE